MSGFHEWHLGLGSSGSSGQWWQHFENRKAEGGVIHGDHGTQFKPADRAKPGTHENSHETRGASNALTPDSWVQDVADVLRHHRVETMGLEPTTPCLQTRMARTPC